MNRKNRKATKQTTELAKVPEKVTVRRVPREVRPVEVKVPTGPQVYRLDRGDGKVRLEIMSDIKARALNSVRAHSNYTGRWTPAPEADPAQAIVRSALTSAERRQRFAEGLRNDAEWIESIRRTKEEATVATKTTKATKKDKSETSDEGGRARQGWNDIGKCALIRWMGKKGFSASRAAAVLEHCKLDPTKATIHIQLGKGRNDENVPKLTKEQRAELEAVPFEETTRGEKKDKGSKKSTKSTGKKGTKAERRAARKAAKAKAAAETEPAAEEDEEAETTDETDETAEEVDDEETEDEDGD